MALHLESPSRIDRLLYGPQITVGDRTIRYVARVVGRYGGWQSAGSEGVGGWVRMTPVEVIVREPA